MYKDTVTRKKIKYTQSRASGEIAKQTTPEPEDIRNGLGEK